MTRVSVAAGYTVPARCLTPTRGARYFADFGIEGDYEGIGNCIIGYADGAEPDAAPRRAGRVFYAK